MVLPLSHMRLYRERNSFFIRGVVEEEEGRDTTAV
jgi:hypothetical protein